jgi:hypothetical protein
MTMSEQEKVFITEIRKEFCDMKEDFDKRYSRMSTFLISLLCIVLTAGITVGATQIASASAVKNQVSTNTGNLKYVMDNSVSQKAIDRLIITFENQTGVMEKYLPLDVQGAIKEFNIKSSELRQQIIMFNSDLNPRSATTTTTQ